MPDIQLKLKKIEDCLREELKKEDVLPRYTTILFKLWQDYLYSQETKDLSGDEAGWAAALYYILKKAIMRENKSQADCAEIFSVSRSNLGRKYRQIKDTLYLEDYNADQIPKDEEQVGRKKKKGSYTEVRKKATKEKRGVSPIPLSDKLFVQLFKQVKDLVKLLHQDKEYFEIKKYLKYVEINLVMSGYEVNNNYLEKKFGRLFPQLNMIPKKGRQAEKFVHLYDNYNRAEPFVLIKL
jgi:hypothetical protein